MKWSEISARWTAESPKFFKKVQNAGMTLTATGMAAIATPAIPNVHIPEIVGTLGGYAITAGVCIGIISKLTCVNPNELPKT